MKPKYLRSRWFGSSLAIAACLLAFFSTVKAQTVTDGATPLGLSPGAPAGSYSLSDFDSVNPYNGSLNFNLPLVKIAGRGGAGYTMSARIDQKWLVDREPQDPPQPNLFTPNPNWWNIEGFVPIYSAGRLDVRQSGTYEYSILGSCGYVHNQTLTRLTFTTPDGTEFELRDQLTNGQPKQPTSCDPGFNRGKVFVTSDGSSAVFTSDADIKDYNYDNPANIPPSGDLIMRDGTHYRIDGGVVSWMRDRNGNKLTFTYASDFSRHVTGITDSLNRQVTISYATSVGGYDLITLKGFGGATRTIKVYHSYLHDALRSDVSLQTYHQLFPELNGAYGNNVDPPIISAVELPNGQSYHFYYNSYAELARVVLPTGGAIEYDYAAGLTDGAASGVLPVYNNFKNIYRRVIERRVYPDGATGTSFASRMTYSRPETTTSNAGYVVTDQYNASGTLLNRSLHYFYGSARLSFNQTPTQYSGWEDGREYQTSVYAADGTTELRRVTSTFAQRAAVSWWTGSSSQEPPNDPRLTETDTTLVDSNQVSKQTFGYDDSVPFNNQNNVKEYDLGSGSVGSLVRETRTTFVTSSSYTDLGLLSLPSQVSIYDGGGVERARTTLEYDNYTADSSHAGLIGRSSISGFDSSFTTSYTTRGNATGTTHYLLNSSGTVTSYAQYDIAGNAVKGIDARGNAIAIDFTDRFGAPNGEAESNSGATELAGQSSYAFPTLVTNAVGHTAYTQFDYYLGRPVDSEDANGITSSGYYDDALDRPTQMVRAVNGGTDTKGQTGFSYDDTNHVITTTGDQVSYNDNVLKSQVLYDGLGRATEKRQYEGGTNYIAVQMQYDALGRAYKNSNPFRPWQSESVLWTTSAFDALGRVVSVTTPDSAVVATSFSGSTVTVTDQAGKGRKSVSDGLGRLVQVYEDPSSLNYLTSYNYDTLDNLTSVSQGSQTRSFAYDSLKRLLSATNPESGTINYSYDNNGNLLTKTDARSITATYVYDVLNRVTTRSYSDGTPTVTYAYDPNVTNGKGRLSSVSSSVSSYSYGSYDALGRTLTATQTIGSQAYSMSYGYDLASHVTSMTYPSGHTVTNTFDSGGRLSSLAGTLGDNTSRTYSTGIAYDAGGRMTQEQFGTSTAIYNKLFYNSRGQLAEIREGVTGGDTNWERGAIINHYSDNCWGMCSGSSMPDNNGNLHKQDVYIPGVSTPFSQFYSYDSLNRLQSVREDNLNGTANWKQSYVYDRYGNRTVDQNSANTYGSGIPKPYFAVDTTNNNNRLIVPSGYGGTMTYDSAGNLTTDTYSAAAVTRLYDAENRMTKETQASSYVAGEYSYDGDGRRVKRKVGTVETWQVYGIGGELIAEYATNTGASSPEKEYGYRNGQLLITTTCGSGYGDPPVLHDNPLVVGETTVQTRHITELRTAINTLRARESMAAYSWTTSATTSDWITAAPIAEMRTALDQVLGSPPSGYSSGLAQGQPIKAVHIQELRDRLTAAWSIEIRWLVTDQLGTPRMIFDASGSLATASRHDYLPFGEELFAGMGGRTTSQGYSLGDGARQKFTQKERDNETGLDYFLARYYSSTQGRFTSVDPQNVVFEKGQGRNASERAKILQAYLVQPQNWNKYTYTRNNPLAYTDPNGRCSAPSGLSKGNVGICVEAFIASPTIGSGAIHGLGDNRTFAANDASKTFRIEVTGTIFRSADAWNARLKGSAGVSDAVVLGVTMGRQGHIDYDAKITSVDKDGNAHIHLTMTGVNGFSGAPGAPQGEIQVNVNLVVTPDGKVGLDGGDRTAYPSVGIYSYNLGSDGKPVVGLSREYSETNPAALTQPTVPIDSAAPTCGCPTNQEQPNRRRRKKDEEE